MDKKKIFNKDDLQWQKQLNSIFKVKNNDSINLFFQAVSLILSFTSKNKDMLEMYKLLGLENFTKLVNFFDGKVVKVTKSNEFKEAMMLSLYYYMRNVENKSWEEIKKEVPFHVKSIKYGIRMKKLNDYVKKELDDLFNKFEEEK